jgi:type VI secretion system protein ImpF
VKGVDHEIRVVPSVLDRLIDLEPKSSRDVLPTRAESVRALRRAVKDDLDSLLNSRNSFYDLPADFAEARQSVLTYGLPDLSALNIFSPRDRDRLRHALETTIQTFEPRLTGIVATVTPPTTADRSLRLHVDARLVMDPDPQPVSFDIVMPPYTRSYEVKEGG